MEALTVHMKFQRFNFCWGLNEIEQDLAPPSNPASAIPVSASLDDYTKV